MKKSFLFILTLFPILLFAQPKWDYTWLFGYADSDDQEFGGTLTKFNNDTISTEYVDTFY